MNIEPQTSSPASIRNTNGVQGPDLSPAAFGRIASLAKREAGLDIGEGKAAMVRTRLARRLRVLGLPDYEAYCDVVESDAPEELGQMISALTTNVSHFYREPHHFEFLRTAVLPSLKDRSERDGPIRIWSAGCANGQEPYTIAIECAKAGLSPNQVRILATDIDPVVVGTGRRGIYDHGMVAGIDHDTLATHFSRPDPKRYQARPELRDYVSFNPLNLLQTWPMKKKLDIVFCRNVVIYFDKPTQAALWRRFADCLAMGGYLFLGHSERIDDASEGLFRKVGVTTYLRAAPSHVSIEREN